MFTNISQSFSLCGGFLSRRGCLLTTVYLKINRFLWSVCYHCSCCLLGTGKFSILPAPERLPECFRVVSLREDSAETNESLTIFAWGFPNPLSWSKWLSKTERLEERLHSVLFRWSTWKIVFGCSKLDRCVDSALPGWSLQQSTFQLHVANFEREQPDQLELQEFNLFLIVLLFHLLLLYGFV